MRKSLIGLVLALSLSSLPAFSANTPKAGSACNKKGVTKTYKGKEFKCLKKGGKFVWSKGKVVNKESSVSAPEVTPSVAPSPTPTPSPTPSPMLTTIPTPIPMLTPNGASTQTSPNQTYWEAKVINSEINGLVSQIQAENPKIDWIIEDDSNREEIFWTKKGLEKAIQFYELFGLTSEKPKVFVGSGELWLRSELTSVGCNLPVFADSLGFVIRGACGTDSIHLFARSFSSVPRFKSPQSSVMSFEFQHVLAHEFFHQLQIESSINFGTLPVWFIEGSAHLFSSMAYASWNPYATYEKHLDNLIKRYFPDTYLDCKNISMKQVSLLRRDDEWFNRKCAYSIGAKATELLIYKFGFKSYLQILKYKDNKLFDEVFREITDSEVEAFYDNVDSFLDKLDWNTTKS